MSYKRIKKIQQKQKKSHLIPDELIKGKRFAEIVSRIGEKSELTNRDRYIYGYSLLQTQQNLEALVNLWPLAAKGHAKLQEDCAVIATYVFADENRLSSVHLSDDALYTLFLAGENLAPQSAAYHALRQRLFDTLWQQGHFEKLERILKFSKEEFSDVLVENLSKLDFFQPKRKLIGNIPAFVGHVLTGGACLIARDPIYHSDIANEIRLLANEIKYLFYQLKTNNQPLTWDRTLFENFVDYEASILIHVLQMAVKNSNIHFDIIPTPSYLMCYDATAKRLSEKSEKFLPWLAAENKELFEAYNADTYHAVLWALCGEKKPCSNKILKSINKDRFSPYLLLAATLRSVAMKKALSGELVRLSDFANFKQTTNVFKDVVTQTIKSIISNRSDTELPEKFWQMLFEFHSVLQDSDCINMLPQLINRLNREYEEQLNLDATTLRNIAHQANAHDLAKQAEILCARQQACTEFLLNLKDEKDERKSKNIIRNIKDEPTLRAHLTLITDCCLLMYEELSVQFFQHIKSIVQNKKINKLISLEDLFDCEFDCTCASCEQMLYRGEIPSIAEELNLPIASIPDMSCYAYTQPSSKTPAPKPSVLLQTDPFKILDVSLTDSKQVIMQKVMQLIQQSPGQMAIYRQAQSELFNPVQRFLHQYLRYLNCKKSNIETNVQQILPLANFPLHKITLRHEFLDEN